MHKSLDELTIKLCEQLPLNITLFEKDGLCEKPNEVCDYCEQYTSKEYACNKKTYTFSPELKVQY